MGLWDRLHRTDETPADQTGHSEPSISGLSISDGMALAKSRHKEIWGRPGRCPECGEMGYLDRIDMVDRVQHEHCKVCFHKWSVAEADAVRADALG